MTVIPKMMWAKIERTWFVQEREAKKLYSDQIELYRFIAYTSFYEV